MTAGLSANSSGENKPAGKPDCIFCQIVAAEASAHRIYQDAETLAFLDLFPAAPGHCLIVTRQHFDDIFSATADSIARIGAVSVPLARAVERATGADGIGIYQLNRAAAGQTVFHYHMHIIPHFIGTTPQIHGRRQASAADLAAMAERIRSALEREIKA